MSEADRVKLAEVQKLVFINLVNGVGRETIRETFRRSDDEIDAIVAFIGTKIISYRFERGMPYVNCRSLDEMIRKKALVLHSLERLNLLTDPNFTNIQVAVMAPDGSATAVEQHILERHAQ